MKSDFEMLAHPFYYLRPAMHDSAICGNLINLCYSGKLIIFILIFHCIVM